MRSVKSAWLTTPQLQVERRYLLELGAVCFHLGSPMRLFSAVLLLLLIFPNLSYAQVDLVKVDKSKRRMYLLQGNEIIREYRIALGKSPKGHKQQEGDQRTPEGHYLLDFIIEDSSFYRSIHISYPNTRDLQLAQLRGVNPGGDIKIHGLKTVMRESRGSYKALIGRTAALPLPIKKWMSFCLVQPGVPILIEW